MEPLPKDISYQKLYEPEQNIWFLNWILKQYGCDSYLNHIILSMPFAVEKNYYTDGQLSILQIFKKCQKHGLVRSWCWMNDIYYEDYDEHWQNNNMLGLEQKFYQNGQLWRKIPSKNGKRHGLEQEFYSTGQLYLEQNWKNGQRHGPAKEWSQSGQLCTNMH